MYKNIPEELRVLRQWVCSNKSKIPLCPRTLEAASVTDATTWGTFEEAVAAKAEFIGFVLTPEDPYCVIDLDDKLEKPATAEQLERHKKILQAFDTYTELSASGRGFHIVARGSVPSGRKRDTVELYPSHRYVIFTGNVIKKAPINDCQALLEMLHGEMSAHAQIDLVDEEGTMTDAELVSMASHAVNADKFNALCAGDMTGYPSQSEADFALMSILAFYTKDNEQVRRLFRMSALGKRDKAQRNDYLNTALKKIRASQPAPIDAGALLENAGRIARGMVEEAVSPPAPFQIHQGNIPQASSKKKAASKAVGGDVEYPAGLIGDLAEYFYSSAVRPVREVSLAAALAVVAGVCGRSFNISGAGLNQYVILLGKTGVGKEGATSGIDKLIAATRPSTPMIDQFLGPATFASGQSLIKTLAERPCFVSVLGEFGLTLQQLSDKRANSSQIMLRRVLLDVYTKSGWQSTLRPMVYSDSERNTRNVQAPCVTILGESTPETFFDGLELAHISEGLIPRFSIIEYTGGRPARNKAAGAPVPAALVKRFSDLAAASMALTSGSTVVEVALSEAAEGMLDAFDARVDSIINATSSEIETQLWNRAHLKALRLAALIATGRDYQRPCVNEEDAAWAIAFVERDVQAVSKRFKAGDVGAGESKQMVELKQAVQNFFKKSYSFVEKRENWVAMRNGGVVPYTYIQPRLVQLASFRHDRMGSNAAIKRVVQTALELGLLVELPKQQTMERFHYRGAAYVLGEEWENELE